MHCKNANFVPCTAPYGMSVLRAWISKERQFVDYFATPPHLKVTWLLRSELIKFYSWLIYHPDLFALREMGVFSDDSSQNQMRGLFSLEINGLLPVTLSALSVYDRRIPYADERLLSGAKVLDTSIFHQTLN